MNSGASRSYYVDILVAEIKQAGLPTPEPEFRFHPKRLWRFDLAWRIHKIGLEVDGGVFANGRHTRGVGFENDCIKFNAAQMLGWTMLRYSTGQVKQGLAIADLRTMFKAREAA